MTGKICPVCQNQGFLTSFTDLHERFGAPDSPAALLLLVAARRQEVRQLEQLYRRSGLHARADAQAVEEAVLASLAWSLRHLIGPEAAAPRPFAGYRTDDAAATPTTPPARRLSVWEAA
ncbi:MAG: hypothetical protein JO247_15595 [Chloroflexi bacterium]|nr:hypothetical protein [Chloroflexota bacterium]